MFTMLEHIDGLCSPQKIPENNSTNSSSEKATSRNAASIPSPTPTLSSSDKTLVNPFGSAVGTMKHMFPCSYRNQEYSLYIASKAICLRRVVLFGLEQDRIIIPLNNIRSINHKDTDKGVDIHTNNDKLFEMTDFQVDSAQVKDTLHEVWKACDNENEEQIGDQEVRDPVMQLFRRFSSLTDSTVAYRSKDRDKESASTKDGETEASDDESSNLDCVSDRAEKIAKLWSDAYLHDPNDDKYSETVIVNLKLNATLDEFYTHFLANNAPASIASHHEATGDLDVEVTDWESTHNNDGITAKKRYITYKHPIKISLAIAPPAGAATKTQLLQRYGDHGISIETETWINDVPLADCFYVADKMLVASKPEGGISLTIRFGTCFVKRTMLKGVIASTSVRDVTNFQKGYVELVQKEDSHFSVNSSPVSLVEVPQLDAINFSTDTTATSKFNEWVTIDKNTCLFSLLLVLTLISLNQFYLIREVNEKLAKLEYLLLESGFNLQECANFL